MASQLHACTVSKPSLKEMLHDITGLPSAVPFPQCVISSLSFVLTCNGTGMSAEAPVDMSTSEFN